MIKINGIGIKTPSKFEVQISDLDGESNRNANGDLIRDRIAVKRKLICEWPPLNQSECSKILKSVKDVFFDVTYPDPELGRVTKTMYVGDRTSPAYQFKDGEVRWSGLKFNLVER
ncbi:MAG: hypothetical protein Q3980_16365 [Turicibacter sp.]|nr:hypothetical protein [Turicibacter sp.]